MKVTILATGEIANYREEYAARLIEQGKAVLTGDEKKGIAPAVPAVAAETPKAEGTGKKK